MKFELITFGPLDEALEALDPNPKPADCGNCSFGCPGVINGGDCGTCNKGGCGGNN